MIRGPDRSDSADDANGTESALGAALREIGIRELGALAQDHRALVQRLRATGRVDGSELRLHERIASHLFAELQRRTAPPRTDPHTYLSRAAAMADPFWIHVPRSRRMFGAAVTLAKRSFVVGLKPLHVELLRPQRAFNEQLVTVLCDVADFGSARDGAWSAWAERTLEPLRDPTAWRVRSDRPGGVGRTVEAVKRRWLRHVVPLLAPLLERQRRWNELAIGAVVRATQRDDLPWHERHGLCGELRRLGSMPASRTLRSLLRALRPLWIELFRRQEAFNLDIAHTLAALFGLPRPAEDGGHDAYELWLTGRDERWDAEARTRLATADRRPLLSIVVPTYETPARLLRACLDSVLTQTYDRWELCVADDGSRSPDVRRVLDEYARRDSRVKVKLLGENGGIARASNAALDLAAGEYVGFLDHDDVLAPFALAEVVIHLNERPETDVLYSDEDRLDMQGRRVMPFFKPAWSPELLRSVNYVCHFLVVRRALLEAVGRLRTGFDGSQDYDLILRLAERTDKVEHIARILYHWRATPTSAAQRIANKPTASDAGMRALREHLARSGEAGTVEAPEPTHYRVRYRVNGTPTVSIVVASGGGSEERLERFAQSLVDTTAYRHFELLVMNNGRPAAARLPVDARVRRLSCTGGSGALRNAGAAAARGDFLLFVHDDLEVVDAAWLEELLGEAQRTAIGAVGAKLLHPDATLQHAGLVVAADPLVVRPFANMGDWRQWTSFGNTGWMRN